MGWILRFVLGFRDSGPDSETEAGFWDFGLDAKISGWILGIRAGFYDFEMDSRMSG